MNIIIFKLKAQDSLMRGFTGLALPDSINQGGEEKCKNLKDSKR